MKVNPYIRIRILRLLFLGQGVYYIITGFWPIAGIESFMDLTGPKTDTWLVHMVGLLALSVGIISVITSRKREWPVEIKLLNVLVALSFASIDIFYVVNDRISAIYLLDAAAEVFFLTVFCLFGRPGKNIPGTMA